MFQHASFQRVHVYSLIIIVGDEKLIYRDTFFFLL